MKTFRATTAKTCSKVCMGLSNKSRRWSKETIAKMVASNRSGELEVRKKLSEMKKGPKCHLWRGGITPQHRMIRASFESKEWSRQILVRDNYTCQKCGKRGGTLNADHIKPFSLFPELRFDLDNGRTLCEDCHRKTPTFGIKVQRMTRSDFELDYQI